MEEGHDEAANEGDDGHREEQAVVALDFNAEDGDVTDDGTTQRAQGKDASSPAEA